MELGLEETLMVGVVAVVVIVLVNALARRVRVAPPLILVTVGVLVSLLPGIPHLEVEPDLILIGVIPPLLYSAAVQLPVVEFRRDFRSISGLSVVLVLLSSVLMGLFFAAVIPDLPFALAVALGAIVSPTDAVAVQIIKRLGVSPRVVTVLEAESMLNDATALVLLRTAVAAAGTALSLGEAVWDFSSAVVIAVIIGLLAGEINVRLRKWVPGSAASTALSFVAPFAAAVPAEALGASGLVAAVVAGIVTGHRAPRLLRPQDRISEHANWRTADLLLEGAVFLIMGLELIGIVEEVKETHGSVWFAVGLGAFALVLVLVIRTAFIGPLLLWLRHQTHSVRRRRDRVEEVARSHPDADRRERLERRVESHAAYADYLTNRPMRWQEGGVLVWAGMRGAITLAAAQTLPHDTPLRATLILVAFVVAAGSLMIQGATLRTVTVKLGVAGESEHDEAERDHLRDLLLDTADRVLADPGLRRGDGQEYRPETLAAVRRAMHHARDEDEDEQDLGATFHELRLAVIDAQRERLLEASAIGAYGSHALAAALRVLDADQISAELRGGEPEEGD